MNSKEKEVIFKKLLNKMKMLSSMKDVSEIDQVILILENLNEDPPKKLSFFLF